MKQVFVRLFNLVYVFFIGVATLVLVTSIYFNSQYSHLTMLEIEFYLNSGLNGADLSAIINGVKDNLLLFIFLYVIFAIPILNFGKYKYYLRINIKDKEKKIYINRLPFTVKSTYMFLIVLLVAGISINNLKIFEFVSAKTNYSTFIEENYISPQDVQIKFPEKKKNLIVLYLESFETTMMDKNSGGAWEQTVTPNMQKYAEKNINFSNDAKIGGALPVTGATWTIAGLVSINSGIPLKTPSEGNNYSGENNFLSGAYSLGDVLKREGYNTRFIFGSDSKFGGRYQFFKTHGNYEIVDLNTVIADGRMKEEEQVFWGFEDEKLFEWSKQEILDLASKDEPFNFNLLTVDTHFSDGYVDENSETKFGTQYENAHATSDRQIAEFLSWLEKQDFYDNTTVVLVGDHLSMQESSYYKGKIDENFDRVTLNIFINADETPVKAKQRSFSNLDMFPTILSSIGVKIEGNRLGLGTNLFSAEPTLFEQYGVEYVNKELEAQSKFYNDVILGEAYAQYLMNKK